MKAKLQLYKEDTPKISIFWENNFERSVVEGVFENESKVLALRFANCIVLERMDKELEKIINKYFKNKESKGDEK